jgi:Fe-S-cluster-containing dehydrogenase component
MDKCSLCDERLAAGKKPICVDSCPMEALEIVDMDAMNWAVYHKEVPGFQDITITEPNIGFVIPAAAESVRRDSK